jgi:TetR/AcrR family tetracycline transcriptional repressor
MTLDRTRITEAAVELLDEEGLAGLSTRRLAAKLGVQSPTLYWHVRGKDELLDLVAEAICADAFTIDETASWRDQLAAGLRQFRAILTKHRDAAALLRQRPPTGPHRLRYVDLTLAILLRAGFTEQDAAGISRLLAAHVLDSVPTRPKQSWNVDVAGYPHLRTVAPAFARLDDTAVFELGCEIILDGLAYRQSRGKSESDCTR